MNEKLFKMIFFASIGVELVVVCIVIAFVSPLVGILMAVVLALAESFAYIWILPQIAGRGSVGEEDVEDGPSPGR